MGVFMRRAGHRGAPADPSMHAAGFGGVVLDPHGLTIAFSDPGVAIDLGGIAKGYALDRACGVLREAGIGAALVHGGTSSIAAIGAPPGTDGWRVRLSGGDAELVLRDCSAAVSAPSGRVTGTGAGHIIDPRTGNPVGLEIEAAVVGESGTLADAWATALVVSGGRPDRMPPEIGSAVRVGGQWGVSPGMDEFFRVLPPGV
jgi:thiamine biosynthesis lipoprotein